jgi:protein-S-isoprenylcysteine O-methyltransferase Ste14
MRRLNLYALIALNIVAFHAPGIWLFFFLLFPEQGTGGISDALFNALLVVFWGGTHSIVARKFFRDFLAGLVGKDFVKLAFTVIAGVTQCVMLYYWRPLDGVLWHAEGVLYWVSAFLFACAFGAVFYCSILLDYMEVLGVRKIVRYFRGEPDPAPALCLKGPYRFCRHPVYLATVACLWIGPVMTTGRLEFALLVTIYVLIGTWFEERDTRKEMGEAYDLYRANVPMWIPRLTPWRGDGMG